MTCTSYLLLREWWSTRSPFWQNLHTQSTVYNFQLLFKWRENLKKFLFLLIFSSTSSITDSFICLLIIIIGHAAQLVGH